MNTGLVTPPGGSSAADGGWVLDSLIVIAKRKKLVAVISGGTTLMCLTVALLLPNVYTGTAKLMPPQQSQSSAAMLLGQLGGLGLFAGGQLGIKNPNDLYVGMLNSRTVADVLIERFKLQQLYDTNTMVETRKVLADKTAITASKDGLITIEVDDEDPARAAAIANAYTEQLDKLTQVLAVTEAAQRRLFFERQVNEAKEKLAEAEMLLKTTQEQTGLIKLDDQGRAIIEAVATLRAQIAAKEIELRSMRTFATQGNPDYIRVQEQLVGLKAELSKLERKQSTSVGDVLVPTGRVPEAGLEYLRRFRNVKYYETVFELLAKQFEMAKIDEAKDAAIVQVVDRAVPPDRKAKPKRLLIVVLGMFAGLFIALLAAFAREAKERIEEDGAGASRLAMLRSYLRIR